MGKGAGAVPVDRISTSGIPAQAPLGRAGNPGGGMGLCCRDWKSVCEAPSQRGTRSLLKKGDSPLCVGNRAGCVVGRCHDWLR